MNITKERALAELWRRGEISDIKLHATQLDIYGAFKASKARKFVVNCSRRLGKSYMFCVICDETARRTPNTQIKYAAPTAKAVRKIVKPIFKKLWDDCPKDLRPKWDSMDQCYKYPNGSEIHIAGTDQGNAENLRGTEAKLVIVDEAGICDDLEYVLQDILMPQTLTCNGRILIGSTPPRTPGHEYVKIYLEAKTRGASIDKTIHDNPLVTAEQIAEYMDESGGADSTTWKREYLAQFVTDAETQIIPEFTEEKQKQLVQEIQTPSHYDAYVSMDVGFEDLTFIVFGYWDFSSGCLVVQDEVVLQGGTEVRTDIIASMTRNMETDLWDEKPPYLRVSDTEPILLNDLQETYGVQFLPTEKDNKEAAINALRLLVTQNKLVIHPRCQSLIAHLRYGVWDKKRKNFERTKAHGHFDGIDALVYMVRNIRKDNNPYPHKRHDQYTEFVPEYQPPLNSTAKGFRDLFSTFSRRVGGNNGR